MTLDEFNAWLEGYSASFTDGAPNAEQWEAIKGKLASIQPLKFAPYGPRPHDTMTEPLPYIRPYWVDAPTSAPNPGWPLSPIVTC